MALMGSIRDRIAKQRSGGIDGPDPTGFHMSVSELGNVMLIVHDLGLVEDQPVTIAADGKSVRILQGTRVALQTEDEANATLPAMRDAGRIDVLEMDEESGKALRIHRATLAN